MTKAGDEDLIRALITNQARAIRLKDAEATLAVYAPNLVRYDLAPPLATIGPRAIDRADLQAWFDTWKGLIDIDQRDFAIAVSGDLAICHGFLRISGIKTDGAHNSLWTRQTLCLQRLDGDWRIVHEHVSVPFLMDGSGRAALDLEP